MKPSILMLLVGAQAAGLLACSGQVVDDVDSTLGSARRDVVGQDTYLYFRCNATNFQPNDGTRLTPTEVPGQYSLSYEVTQSWMISGFDHCSFTETNQLNGWGTWQGHYGADGGDPIEVPGAGTIRVDGDDWFNVRYPKLGKFTITVDLPSGDFTIEPESRTVFLTSTVHSPDYGSAAAADAVCQQHADDAGLEGTFRAWLSDANSSPNTRFNPSSGPYRRVDGTKVADNYADLTDGSLDAPINLDENGQTPDLPNDFVFTGTTLEGDVVVPDDYIEYGTTCDDWTDTSGLHWGARGNFNRVNQGWTYYGGRVGCSWQLPIYCMEQ